MIKSWWEDKSHRERALLVALALLTGGLFLWYGIINPVDKRIGTQQDQVKKMKRDLVWMEEQAIAHGLLPRHALVQSLEHIVLNEAKQAGLSIQTESEASGRLVVRPEALPADGLSRWLSALQLTHGVVIEEFELASDTRNKANISVEKLILRSPGDAE